MTPSSMGQFVKGGRSGSPSRPQSANSRRAAADAARVKMAKTTLRHEPAQQHPSTRRQAGNTVNPPAVQANNGQRRESGESHNAGRRDDRYGTDAGSLDTTVNGHSEVRIEDSQRAGRQQYAQAQGNAEAIEDYDTDQEDDDSEDEEQDDGLYPGDQDFDEEAHQELQERGFYLGGGNSYPSTTSGPPDDFFNNWKTGQQPPFEDFQDDGPSTPPRKTVKAHPTQVAPGLANAPAKTQPDSNATRPAMSGQANILRKAAIFREDERGNTTLAMRGGSSFQANVAPVISSQPPNYGQGAPEASRTANVASRNRPPAMVNPAHQRTSHAPPLKQMVPAAPVARPAQPQSKREPQRFIEDSPTRDPVAPLTDYDMPALLNMSYDQLRDEDFDTVPRGKTAVLSPDMQQKPLDERLEHVQKNLNGGDQDTFFRALPTREWEDSGDWFLNRFGDIINRMKDARQNKRKLARGFEDTVEKRYRHVAKRQQHVQAALDKMKTQGQGLIPKSPRASKSPHPRRV